MKRLFHFSDDPDIARFVPRPVAVASMRDPGRAWLNGPLVWTIDEHHAFMYLFPRNCPRILLWARPDTRPDDRQRWLGDLRNGVSAVAYLERSRFDEFQSGVLYRYELPPATFVDLEDAGMWVSRESVRPLSILRVADLPSALARCGTELRVVDSLVPLRDVWNSSVHASGIRLRNAAGWSG